MIGRARLTSRIESTAVAAAGAQIETGATAERVDQRVELVA